MHFRYTDKLECLIRDVIRERVCYIFIHCRDQGFFQVLMLEMMNLLQLAMSMLIYISYGNISR